MMSLILLFIILLILILIIFFLFIYSAHKDYVVRRDQQDYVPKLYKRTGEVLYKERPLNNKQSQDNIYLSLVFPAYNEEKRLPPTIEKTVKYFDQQKFNYEILIVNDGSRDNTLGIIKELQDKYPDNEIISVNYAKNAGKGFAVRTGMTFARGQYILMLDSDGATDIADFKVLMDKINNKNNCIAIGSRRLITENVERVWWRSILGNINNFIVRTLIGIKNIKDTQCGFKLFPRDACRHIFFNLHLVRWAFDVEMIYIAQHSGINVIEVPVNWHEVSGSKLVFVPATISFFRDYFAIIVFYIIRLWRIKKV